MTYPIDKPNQMAAIKQPNDGKEIHTLWKFILNERFDLLLIDKPSCLSNYKWFEQYNKCLLLTIGWIMPNNDRF